MSLPQIMEGNLTRGMEKWLPLVEHVQVAQAPDRGPLDSRGEVNYR